MERIKKALEKARASTSMALEHSRSKPASEASIARPRGISVTNVKAESIDPVLLERNRIVSGNKSDPMSTAFDMLRTRVLREMRDKGYRTLGVTSPMPHCGKTTVAINLAISVAQLTGPIVLLGDLDLRRPMIGEYLGLHTENDLSDYLEGRVPLEGALAVTSEIPRLLVLPNYTPYRNATEMLTAPKMSTLSDLLRSEQAERVNILDLPPMLPTDDTIAFLPQIDCILLVVEYGVTQIQELEDTIRLLEGTTLVGVALNKSDVQQQRSYY